MVSRFPYYYLEWKLVENSSNIKICSKCRLFSRFFPKNFSSVSKDWTLFQLFNPTIRAKTLQSVNSRQDYKSWLSGVSINCITRNCSMVVVQGFASKSFGGPSGPRWIAIQGGGSWVRSGFAFMAFDHAIPRYEGHRR